MSKKTRHNSKGFIHIPALMAGLVFVVGSLIVGLTVNKVTNLDNSQDTRSQASTCDVYGVCSTPTPGPATTCNGSCIGVSSCSQLGNTMGSGTGTCPTGTICCKPIPTPTPRPVVTPIPTPSLKANYASCSTSSECQSNNCQTAPGGKFCLPSGHTIAAKVAAGGTCCTTAYNRECVTGYSCQSNTCKPLPTPSPTPAFKKAQGEECKDSSECLSGNCSNVAQYEAGAPIIYPFPVCLASSKDQAIVLDASLKTQAAGAAAAIGVYVAPIAIPYTATALSSAPAWFTKGMTALNLLDDAITSAQCAGGDVNACSQITATIVNPIPGVGLADDVVDIFTSFKPQNVLPNTLVADLVPPTSNLPTLPAFTADEMLDNVIDQIYRNADTLNAEMLTYTNVRYLPKSAVETNPYHGVNMTGTPYQPVDVKSALKQVEAEDPTGAIAAYYRGVNNAASTEPQAILDSVINEMSIANPSIPIVWGNPSKSFDENIIKLQTGDVVPTHISVDTFGLRVDTYTDRSWTSTTGNAIVLNENFKNDPRLLRTPLHETGHIVEENFGALGNINASTEAISCLYGICAAKAVSTIDQTLAEQMAKSQVMLYNWTMFGTVAP